MPNEIEVTAYTGIEPGIHDINVTGLESKQAKAGGDYFRWEFTRQDGKTTSANSSTEMTPGNKTGKWFATLTGRPTVVGERRSISEVIGKPATIVVELNADGFTKVIALTGRNATVPRHDDAASRLDISSTPADKDLREAAEKAAQQHAIQEGDEHTEIGVLP